MDGSFGISIDRGGRLSLSEQIADGIRAAIREGRLPPGARLPSWNDLATQLGVARGTVRSAYESLADGQFVIAAGAAGTRVAKRPPTSRIVPEPAKGKESFGPFPGGATSPLPFQLGVPATDLFPAALWSRKLAQAARDAIAVPTGYPDAAGEPGLRAEIAGYLAVARGLACRPAQVFVTQGYAGAFSLVMRMIRAHGSKAWVEDPGYPFARTALGWSGVEAVGVPVDRDGLDVAAGIAKAPDVAFALVTAGQQAPLGHTMSLERRHALLDWAAGRRWIVEDDFLGELQLVRRAAPALASMDARRVLHIGSFSKTMSPSLRMGFLVVPMDLVDAATQVAGTLEPAPPPVVQMALESFLHEGHYLRHLRRMKRAYAERREAVMGALAARSFACEASGLSVRLPLADGVDDGALAREAMAVGLSPVPLSPWFVSDAMRCSGLLLGVTNVPVDRATAHVNALLDVLARRGVRP
ncbi:PLP-dependent aminotransferase family protein [Luteibacter sp.]|uniref:MocR-like pyridoxine biosynthesis transcription factor PdxR n=1 Tax=Luteibacter sp. TaxID=1886636 RepID=UPI0025C4CB29|nr:PLP-dependent aminotransferase family protein [Luteibacter sp.]